MGLNINTKTHIKYYEKYRGLRENGSGGGNLVENPERVGVSSIEEVIEGVRVGGVDFSVVDEVLSGVFGVVGPCVLWQPPHQPQNGDVCSQSLLHFLPRFGLPNDTRFYAVHWFLWAFVWTGRGRASLFKSKSNYI